MRCSVLVSLPLYWSKITCKRLSDGELLCVYDYNKHSSAALLYHSFSFSLTGYVPESRGPEFSWSFERHEFLYS